MHDVLNKYFAYFIKSSLVLLLLLQFLFLSLFFLPSLLLLLRTALPLSTPALTLSSRYFFTVCCACALWPHANSGVTVNENVSSANPLGDDRFGAMFESAAFEVDPTSEEYARAHPTSLIANKIVGRFSTAVTVIPRLLQCSINSTINRLRVFL